MVFIFYFNFVTSDYTFLIFISTQKKDPHMKKYHCEYCKRDLLHDKLSGRIMHNNGYKHNLNKKTYFLEILEDKNKKAELDAMIRQLKNENLRRID